MVLGASRNTSGTAATGSMETILPDVEFPGRDSTVIVVMGETGSGKSTFIKAATGNRDIVVGHNLKSCTQSVMWYQVPGTNVYLVDTPGFNDTYHDDRTILLTIAQLFEDFFHEYVETRGVIYMHDILEAKMKRSSLKNMRMFEKIVGNNNLGQCCLVTSKWSLQPEQRSIGREAELIENKDFWGLVRSRGAGVRRFRDTFESAREIWGSLSGQSSFTAQITEEYTYQDRPLALTEAGREVEENLEETKKAHMEEVEALKTDLQRARDERDRELEVYADTERRKLEAELERMRNDQKIFEEEKQQQLAKFNQRMEDMSKKYEESISSALSENREERKARKIRRRNRRGRWVARLGGALFLMNMPSTDGKIAGGVLGIAAVEGLCQFQKEYENEKYGLKGFDS